MNEIRLLGNVVGVPKVSHVTHGITMYEVYISTKRLSGYEDVAKCMVPEYLIEEFYTDMVGVIGEIRTRREEEPGKNRLDIYVQVKATFGCHKDRDFNFVNLEGFVSSKPTTLRQTPLGRIISDAFILSERKEEKKIDYIPCIVWGDLAIDSWALEPGAKVTIAGRLQSRNYTKQYNDGTSEERVAYEVSVNTLVKEEEYEG